MISDFLVVAGFELRQQIRSNVFRVVFAISAAMVFGAMIVDELRVGLADEIVRNSASVIVQTHLVWTLFYMFTAAAFVADAVLRDELTGFAPLIRSAPIRAVHYLMGRFAGAFLSVLVCFASVPAAILLANLVPGLDPATIGPARPGAYAFAFFVMAAPNLFLVSAVSFGLTTLTRSMTGALLGAVALLVLYGLAFRWDTRLVGPILEPFGFLAFSQAAAGLDAGGSGRIGALVGGTLLANRLLWFGVGVALLLASFAAIGQRRSTPLQATPSDAAARTQGERAPTALPRRQPPSISRRTVVLQFAARTRWELRAILRSPVLAVLLILGGVNALAALMAMGPGPTGSPDTARVTTTLFQAFRLLPTTIVLFFAGELMWREREHGVDDIIASAPMPTAAFLLPKLLALLAVLSLLSLASGAMGALVQLAHGGASGSVLALLRTWVLPSTFDWALVAVLAFFLQSLSPDKIAGWGWLVLFLIASLTLDRLGLVDPIYRYGRHPGWPLPASVSGEANVGLYHAYWASFACLLLAATSLLAGRTLGEPLGRRLRLVPGRARGVTGFVLVVSALAFLALGAILLRLS